MSSALKEKARTGLSKTPTFATIKKGEKSLVDGVSGLGSNKCKLNFTSKVLKKEYKRCKSIGCTIHAETDAIKKALSQNISLKGTCIYVSRITMKGDMALAKPCSDCILVIKLVGIKKVYYTSDSGWKVEKSRDIEGVPSSAVRRGEQ